MVFADASAVRMAASSCTVRVTSAETVTATEILWCVFGSAAGEAMPSSEIMVRMPNAGERIVGMSTAEQVEAGMRFAA